MVRCYVDEIEYEYYIFSRWSSTNSETLNPVEIWIKGTNPIESLSCRSLRPDAPWHSNILRACSANCFLAYNQAWIFCCCRTFDRKFLGDQLARQAPKGMSIHSISFIYPQYFNFKYKIMIHFIWYLLLNYQQPSKPILLCIPFVELTIAIIETVRDSATLILNKQST